MQLYALKILDDDSPKFDVFLTELPRALSRSSIANIHKFCPSDQEIDEDEIEKFSVFREMI